MANEKFTKLLERIRTDKLRGLKAAEAILKTKSGFSDLEITVLYAEVISNYLTFHDSSRIINLFEQYKKLKITDDFTNNIDIDCCAGIAYAKHHEFKKSVVSLQKYADEITLYREGKYSFDDETYRKPHFVDEYDVLSLDLLTVGYRELGRGEEALKAYFQKRHLEKPDWDETMLTIGMIVKNESKILGETLKALNNLRKNVKCELIIVDTGSDDNTVEIAKEYADEIRYFEWNGDFSDARNESLRDAKGDWFMYIDADETFENTDDIEEFFNSPEHLKYNFGSFIVRNYTKNDLYSDFLAPRLTRVFNDTKFTGSIHESLNMSPPTYYFKSFAHHRGYEGTNLQKKNSRNITNLLHEHAQNPNDVRVIHLLTEAYRMVDLNAGLNYALMGLEISKNTNNEIYVAVYRAEICYIYLRMNDSKKAYEASKEYAAIYDKNKTEYCILTDIYAIYGIAANYLDHYEEAIRAFKRYYYFYEATKSGRLSTNDLMVNPPVYAQDFTRQRVMSGFCFAYTKLDDYVNAKKIADMMDKPQKSFHDINFDYVSLRLQIMRNLSDYSDLSKLVSDVLESDVGDDIRQHLYQSLTVEISLVKEAGSDFAPIVKMIKDIVDSSKKDSFPNDFISLIYCLDLFINERTADENLINSTINNIESMTINNADIIPLLMINDYNIDIVSDRFTTEFINVAAAGITIYEEDLLDIVSEYSRKIDPNMLSARSQLLLLNLCGYLLKSYNENSKYSPDDVTALYVTLTANYLEKTYKPEIISIENTEHMSKPVQIGFYLFLAAVGLADGDRLAHIKNLRKLISIEPMLKEYVNNEIKNAV
jgi:glycosyltransferase involved in cell wall biosynthesis